MRLSRVTLMLAVLTISSMGVSPLIGQAATQQVAYTYDELGRITSAVYDGSWVVEWEWDENGNLLSRTSGPVTVDVAESVLPARFSLSRAVPNPSRGAVKLQFSLPVRSQTDIAVFNLAGRRIRTLANKELEAGVHPVLWDGRDDVGRRVGSGIYFLRMRAGEFQATDRITYLQ